MMSYSRNVFIIPGMHGWVTQGMFPKYLALMIDSRNDELLKEFLLNTLHIMMRDSRNVFIIPGIHGWVTQGVFPKYLAYIDEWLNECLLPGIYWWVTQGMSPKYLAYIDEWLKECLLLLPLYYFHAKLGSQDREAFPFCSYYPTAAATLKW
jgi:hypothetical protein